LADDCRFPDARIGDPTAAVFALQMSPALVDAAEQTDVFSNGD
jgi:hypothetical protein